jgi:NADH-quinone oxidoreductase subunit N
MKIWQASKLFLPFIILYQFFLLLYYIILYQQGVILKVGLAGSFNLPFNLALAKLFAILFIYVGLFLTILLYLEYYTKNILFIKPELCSILFFLGFSSGMVFLQNDLFSIFLYFEVISFCIYGLLFLQKRTNAQLHSLVRYVLLSLWVSTCYILGTALYIAAYVTSTNVADFKTNPQNSIIYNFDGMLLEDFELIFAITFIMIYFLFKLGAGPFYTWTVEVYNACTTSALFIVSLLPKLVYFPVLFFLLFFNFIEYYAYWTNLLVVMGILTVFIGSFGILITDKLKEIYAWSSLIHTGNLLIMLSCISTVTLTFLMFYLLSYYLISYGFILLITSL